jgi:hypothetical protein
MNASTPRLAELPYQELLREISRSHDRLVSAIGRANAAGAKDELKVRLAHQVEYLKRRRAMGYDTEKESA